MTSSIISPVPHTLLANTTLGTEVDQGDGRVVFACLRDHLTHTCAELSITVSCPTNTAITTTGVGQADLITAPPDTGIGSGKAFDSI